MLQRQRVPVSPPESLCRRGRLRSVCRQGRWLRQGTWWRLSARWRLPFRGGVSARWRPIAHAVHLLHAGSLRQGTRLPVPPSRVGRSWLAHERFQWVPSGACCAPSFASFRDPQIPTARGGSSLRAQSDASSARRAQSSVCGHKGVWLLQRQGPARSTGDGRRARQPVFPQPVQSVGVQGQSGPVWECGGERAQGARGGGCVQASCARRGGGAERWQSSGGAVAHQVSPEEAGRAAGSGR
mmetsp:Transcript_7799/g.14745  ORF Transcript_7799/g.14745 Transcript_7799/m.14745 type:complete len:240 (-) Transcript_7799:1031-1750(-)